MRSVRGPSVPEARGPETLQKPETMAAASRAMLERPPLDTKVRGTKSLACDSD